MSRLDQKRQELPRGFWAVGDGVTDDTAAFRAVAALGRPILVPYTPSGYRITGTITMASNAVFYGEDGERPRLFMDSATISRMFDFNGATKAGLRYLVLDGRKATTPSSDFIRVRDCVECFLEDLDIDDMPGTNAGGIVFSGTTTRSRVRRATFDDPEGTAVYFTGSDVTRNRIEDIEVFNGGGFGVFFGQGAHRNLVRGVNAVDTAKEGVALTFPCHHNRIEGCHIESAGDNGISISGNHNVVVGNQCLFNAFAGIGVWGAYNVISANVCVGNDQALTQDWGGVWIDNGYGGSGQNNTVIGNIIDDTQAVPTQKWGVRVKSNAYTTWAQGQVIAVNEYRINGLNIYQARTAGTTGATAPVHTAGDVSDGGVTWGWVNAHRSQATPRANMVVFNTPGRVAAGGQSANDNSNWVNNMLYGYGADTRVPWPTSASGLQTGQIYSNARVLTLAP